MPDDRPLLVYRRLLGYVRGFGLRLLLVLLVLGVHAGCTLVFPWLIKTVLQDTILNDPEHSVVFAIGLLVLALLVMNLAEFFAGDQLEAISLRLMERIRNDLVAKFVRLPAEEIARSRSGDALSRVFNDVPVLKSFLNFAFFSLGSDLLRTVGSIGILFVLSWRLALVTLGAGAVGAFVIVGTSRWTRRTFHRVQVALADMTSLLSEQVRALPTIQAFGTAEQERRRFAESSATYSEQAILGNRLHVAVRAALNFLGAALVVLVLGFGMGQMQIGADGPVTMPGDQLLGFALYAGLLAEPITRLSRTNHHIQQALAAGRHIFELLDLPEEIERAGMVSLPARPQGVLQFEGVYFHYRPDHPVLCGIDLTIRAGETVAIVGTSGAGKSTLTQLALRFFEPVTGVVRLDGHDLRDLSRADLRRHIGWVGQDPFLFRGTVAENIRYGCGDVTPEAIEHAARLACADPFIRRLPHGYASRIGERGVDLSGGQRARLALARVILRSSAIVILDEATAALDTETEHRLWKGLEDWMRQRTTLIIAHRLHTVLSCPRIVVLDEGKVQGDGPADQLRCSCPAFNRIFLEQLHLGSRAA